MTGRLAGVTWIVLFSAGEVFAGELAVVQGEAPLNLEFHEPPPAEWLADQAAGGDSYRAAVPLPRARFAGPTWTS